MPRLCVGHSDHMAIATLRGSCHREEYHFQEVTPEERWGVETLHMLGISNFTPARLFYPC